MFSISQWSPTATAVPPLGRADRVVSGLNSYKSQRHLENLLQLLFHGITM